MLNGIVRETEKDSCAELMNNYLANESLWQELGYSDISAGSKVRYS